MKIRQPEDELKHLLTKHSILIYKFYIFV